jgi:hypothetical protein
MVSELYNKNLQIARASYNNKTPNGFSKVRDMSDRRSKVYRDNKNGDIYVGFRGTQPTNLNDLRSDLNILNGTQSKDNRFIESAEKVKNIKQIFPDSKVYLTGHSLGSKISQDIARSQKGIAGSFNFSPGTNPLIEGFTKNFGKTSKTSQYNYATRFDPISSPSLLIKRKNEENKYVKLKGFDPHTLMNYFL